MFLTVAPDFCAHIFQHASSLPVIWGEIIRSNFHIAYLCFNYNILHGRHYFQMISFFLSPDCFSSHSRYSFKWCKPSVVYKTPLSYCFKVSYLLMFSYVFPADNNIYPAKTNLWWILTYSCWTFDPESLQIISRVNICEG